MKTKFTAPAHANSRIIMLASLGAITLCGNVPWLHADQDTPAQAAARAALLQKMQQSDTTTNQSPGASAIPTMAAPATAVPPAPAAPAPVIVTITPPAPVAASVNPPVAAPANGTALSAFGGSSAKSDQQPVPENTDKDPWARAVFPPLPAVKQATSDAGRSLLIPATSAGDPALEHHTEGKIIQDFHADNLELRTALSLFASQNNLNIVPDNNVGGTVTLDVHNLPLDQMMSALLEAGDCAWEEDHGLIRVRNTETRTFAVDYLRVKRAGTGSSSATLSSSSSGGSSGGGGGGGGSSGGGGGGGGDSSSMSLTMDNPTDFWTELRSEISSLLTDSGMKTLAINKTAGIIQVTDRPSALKRLEAYLMATEQSINRQVDIETKIYDVTLNDEFQFGIDWDHVAQAYEGTLGFGTATLPVAIGSASGGLGNSSLSGLNQIGGLQNLAESGSQTPTTLAFQNLNTQAAITALQTQGNVKIVAAPRIRTLNNQTAVIKVGVELPFFSQSSTTTPTGNNALVAESDNITTVTVGTIMSITPQISDDGWISMDISPVLTTLVANEVSPNGTATAPELTDKQASTLARVRDGTTVVLGGLIQSEKDESANKVPLLGDIPVLGKLFTGTFHATARSELVIFVTPHIVAGDEYSARYVDSANDKKK